MPEACPRSWIPSRNCSSGIRKACLRSTSLLSLSRAYIINNHRNHHHHHHPSLKTSKLTLLGMWSTLHFKLHSKLHFKLSISNIGDVILPVINFPEQHKIYLITIIGNSGEFQVSKMSIAFLLAVLRPCQASRRPIRCSGIPDRSSRASASRWMKNATTTRCTRAPAVTIRRNSRPQCPITSSSSRNNSIRITIRSITSNNRHRTTVISPRNRRPPQQRRSHRPRITDKSTTRIIESSIRHTEWPLPCLWFTGHHRPSPASLHPYLLPISVPLLTPTSSLVPRDRKGRRFPLRDQNRQGKPASREYQK